MEIRFRKPQGRLKLKKITLGLIVLFVICSPNLIGQNKTTRVENSRITSNAYLEELIKTPAGVLYSITSQHISSLTGVKHMYVRQALQGLEVYGTESSIHKSSEGTTLMAHVNFVNDIESSLITKSSEIKAEQAISRVAQQMGYRLTSLKQKESLKGISKEGVFNGAGISRNDIPVKLMYYYQEGIGTRLVWELSINEINSINWWNFRVDATTGDIIDKDNWTVNCKSIGDHSEEGHREMIRHANSKVSMAKPNSEEKRVITENTTLASTYTVFPLPLESPYYGPRSLAVDPDDPTASPIGWHDDGTITYTYTKGNNVSAYDDSLDDDVGSEADHTPESSAGLVFDYPFDAVDGGGNPIYSTSAQSEDASITNLFYWNNIIHDITYFYGFTEAAGNFQESNFGFGGLGGDSVNAQAQDSAELPPTSFNSCNASFNTPPDGINPTMQMFICEGTAAPYFNDGAYDNLVVIHEFAHGISNRLIGGAANVSALVNAEQMGEGWSDFYGYMLTMDASNFMDDRAVGNFLADLGPTGPGFRPAPYSIDGMVNGFTYADVADDTMISSPHGIGFIWATMLYDLAQELIGTYGFDPDLYTGTGGNNIAIKLVTEGLKFQSVLPGFVDARDAILAADLALTGGSNECIIWTAFAGRGLGYSAGQGSAFDRFDGVEAFDLPVATLVPNRTSICDSEGVVVGLSGGRLVGGVYSGPFVTDAGDGKTFSFDATAAGVGIHSITYDDPCSSTMAMATIEVIPAGLPVVICKDVTLTLDTSGDASITAEDVVANLPEGTGSLGYTINDTGVFAPEIITGTTVVLAEDGGSSALPIGFDFSYFGKSYTEFYIASNGFVSFTGNGLSGPPSYSSTTIPKTEIPNGMIAMIWDDLSPNISGVVKYETIGVSPTKKLIVSFESVPLYDPTPPSAFTVTTQLHLYEGSNLIEIHTTSAETDGESRTQGIENESGTLGYASASRNFMDWTATSDYIGFKPIKSGLPDNCGSPVTLSFSKTDFTCDDIGTNVVTVTVDDGMGGVATCDATITVVGEITTYTGTWDNGDPDASKKAIFNSSYSTTTADIDACACEIDLGATVTIKAGDYMSVNKNITVGTGSSLIVEHTGSVVQVDKDASVTNNGTINVGITSPILQTRDFMVLGSPMSTETRTDVFSSAFLVLDHTPANFIPHSGVPAGGTNFADDNNNFWNAYTGSITVGEGYIVRPQSGFTDPANHSYSMTYTKGTLNNGDVSRPIVFNGLGTNADGTPNVLANPYASAISASSLITANALISEVYFWEHLTPPSSSIPGFGSINFSMGDISMYNLSGGTKAANDLSVGEDTKPNGVISTAQGFGIKAFGSGTVSFNNTMRLTSGNTTLRNPENTDRIWLNLENHQYKIGSSTLLAFNPEATPQLDPGYDSNRLATAIALYSHLEDGSEQLGIQTREAFEHAIKIPMGFSSQVDASLTYGISISNLDGSNLENVLVYLVDHDLGITTNLSEESYRFVSGKGTFNERFTLQFEEGAILNTLDTSLQAISIYPNPAQDVLNVMSSKILISDVIIYDVLGREVTNVSLNAQGAHQIDISTLEAAMYFVKVVTKNGSTTKRVVKQ